MKIIIFLFLTILLHQTVSGFEMPPECIQKTSDCISCMPEQVNLSASTELDSLSKSVSTLSHFSFLEEQVAKLHKSNSAIKNYFASLFRTLRDGKAEPTHVKATHEIDAIKKDFDRLTDLSKQTIQLQRRFDICLNNCGPIQKLQIQDDLAAIQKLKIALFVKRPILSHKVFEEKLSKLSDAMVENEEHFPAAEFEASLKDSLFQSLQKILERENDFSQFENDGDKPLKKKGNEKYTSTYLDNVTSRFPGIIEDVVKSSFADKANLNSACFFSERFKKYSDVKGRTEFAINAGLVVIPFVTGPLGRAGVWGARLLYSERFAAWGLTSVAAQKALSVAPIVFDVGSTAIGLKQIDELKLKCDRSEVSFMKDASEKQLDALKECQKDLGERIFLTELSVFATGAQGAASVGTKLLAKFAEVKPTSIIAVKSSDEIAEFLFKNGTNGKAHVEFKTPDNGVFSVMDVNAVTKSSSAELKSIPEEYWRYVGNIYSERLNLTPAEIEGFIKSSLEMGPRTKLIINTEKSPIAGQLKLRGGVGIVEAKKADELLPLEKATGIRIEKAPNEKIVEIVRLTVGKDGDAEKLSKALINQATSIITEDKSISRVFIFTSKIHARLYKRMGVPSDKIKEIDKRDVVIEFTRSDLERVLKTKIKTSYLPDLLKISSIMANNMFGGSTPSILTPLMR